MNDPKVPAGTARSPKWAALRKKFLVGKRCAVCGGKKKLEAHHILPFHLHPLRELDVRNLMPLCEGNPSINCHLIFGHLGSFKSFNATAEFDASNWARHMQRRP
jgi:hypothetical protein